MPIRAVCFDLGGVLVRICHTWSEAAKYAGIERSWTAEDALIDSLPLARYQNGDTDLDDYLRELSAQLSLDGSGLELHNHILIEEYSGVSALVDELCDRGLKCGCLSNTNGAHWDELVASERFPVMHRLRPKLASHNAGLSKPDPRFFVLFEDEACVAGHEIAYFDDAPANVAAAQARGWNSFLIDPVRETAPQLRTHLATFGI